MGWKIIFAPQALDQMEQIVRFIAQDDPTAAERFGNYLVDRAELLDDFPELGVPYKKRPNVRRLFANPTSFTIVSVESSRLLRSWTTGTLRAANRKYDDAFTRHWSHVTRHFFNHVLHVLLHEDHRRRGDPSRVGAKSQRVC